MRLVVQKHDFGCGAACVAAVTDKSYQQVVDLLGVEKAQTTGFYCKELQSCLEILGYSYEYRYAKPSKIKLAYLEDSIVFVSRSKRFPAGHYLVRHNGQWLDSWRNFKIGGLVTNARSGYRKRLPSKAKYILYKSK